MLQILTQIHTQHNLNQSFPNQEPPWISGPRVWQQGSKQRRRRRRHDRTEPRGRVRSCVRGYPSVTPRRTPDSRTRGDDFPVCLSGGARPPKRPSGRRRPVRNSDVISPSDLREGKAQRALQSKFESRERRTDGKTLFSTEDFLIL